MPDLIATLVRTAAPARRDWIIFDIEDLRQSLQFFLDELDGSNDAKFISNLEGEQSKHQQRIDSAEKSIGLWKALRENLMISVDFGRKDRREHIEERYREAFRRFEDDVLDPLSELIEDDQEKMRRLQKHLIFLRRNQSGLQTKIPNLAWLFEDAFGGKAAAAESGPFARFAKFAHESLARRPLELGSLKKTMQRHRRKDQGTSSA